jgi:uncharacterized protein YjbI with pentapeptide repeats/Zn-finger nucleic acid-binding protein
MPSKAEMRDGNVKQLLETNTCSNAYLEGAKLTEASLMRAKLSDSNLKYAHLEGAYLNLADMDGVDLEGANLVFARLQEALMNRANLENAYAACAQMHKAILEQANLQNCDLSDADLSGAQLRNANLSGANLQHANLRDADLYGAILFDATLDGADLTGAKLTNAQYDSLVKAHHQNIAHPKGKGKKLSEEAYFAEINDVLISQRRGVLDAERAQRRDKQLKQEHWMCCPKCGHSMVEIEVVGIYIDHCTNCCGNYADKGELELILSVQQPEKFLQALQRRVMEKCNQL